MAIYFGDDRNDSTTGAARGQNYILSGVEPEGDSWTDGLVVLEGELLPFDARGAVGTHIVVEERIEQVTYLEDSDGDGEGDTKDAYFRRVATVSVTSSVAIDSLTRVDAGGLFRVGVAQLLPELRKADVVVDASTGSASVDWMAGIQFLLVLTEATTVSFVNLVAGKTITLVVTGGQALTLPASVVKLEGDYDGARKNIIQLYCSDATVGSSTVVGTVITI